MGPAGHGTGSGRIEWHMAAWLYAQLGEPTVQAIRLPVHVFVFRIIQRISGTGFSVPAESRFLLCDGRKEEKTGDAFFRTAYHARCTSVKCKGNIQTEKREKELEISHTKRQRKGD